MTPTQIATQAAEAIRSPYDESGEAMSPEDTAALILTAAAKMVRESGAESALKNIPPCNVAGDASFVFHTTGSKWCEWMDRRNAALTALRAITEQRP